MVYLLNGIIYTSKKWRNTFYTDMEKSIKYVKWKKEHYMILIAEYDTV